MVLIILLLLLHISKKWRFCGSVVVVVCVFCLPRGCLMILGVSDDDENGQTITTAFHTDDDEDDDERVTDIYVSKVSSTATIACR